MREEHGPGEEEDTWRPPPPNISTSVLFLVFLTASTLFSLAALLLAPSRAALKVVLLALTLAPLLYGLWAAVRSRAQAAVMPPGLYVAIVGVPIAQGLARLILGLDEGRPLGPFDAAFLVLLAAGLIGLLVFRLARGRRKGPG